MSADPITAGLDLLDTVGKIVAAAQAGQTTPAEAIAAARNALGVDPLAGIAAEDAARRTRVRDAARVVRAELDAGMMLPATVHSAIAALVDHHDPEGAENAARAARSEQDMQRVELPKP